MTWRALYHSVLFGCFLLIAGRADASLPPAEHGTASYYAWHFHGRKMANGHRFHALGTTAASRTLPLGTHVMITNLRNGKRAHATIADRGPYIDHRVIDVSLGIARRLRMEQEGLAPVTIEPVESAPKQQRVARWHSNKDWSSIASRRAPRFSGTSSAPRHRAWRRTPRRH